MCVHHLVLSPYDGVRDMARRLLLFWMTLSSLLASGHSKVSSYYFTVTLCNNGRNSMFSRLYSVSKNCTNCFGQNVVKFPSLLIIFSR